MCVCVPAILSEATIRQANRGLKHGTAPDALGWTTETWVTLCRRPELLPVVREILLQHITGHSGGLAQDLVNASRMIALCKDSSGESLRLIAIPTVWRKVVGRASVTHFRDVLRHAAGDFQYAAMTPDGGARMAAATRWQAQTHHHRVFVRTDIQNAFNEIGRHSVYEALPHASPVLAAMQFAWLSRPSVAVLDNPAATNDFLVSSLAFAVALARPLRELRADFPDAGAVAYADDVLLDSQEEDIHRVVNAWHTLVSSLDLRLNPDKIAVWGPSLVAIPPRLMEACPAATFSRDGIVICGVPIEGASSLPEDHGQPLGTPTFTQAFLERLRHKLQLRLRALAAVADALGPSSSAAHLAVHILLVNIQTAFVHIFRACHWTVVHEWAGQLQTDVSTWLSEFLQCPLGGPASQLTLSMRLRFAGLGILNFQYEAALHFVQGALALNDNAALSLGNSETWSYEVGRAIAFLERSSGIDVETVAAPKPPGRQGREIRKHFYEAMAKQLHDMVPGLVPTGKDAPSLSLHVRFLLAWYVASPDTFSPPRCFPTCLGISPSSPCVCS